MSDPLEPAARRPPGDPQAVAATEHWFVRHGLPWFVPAEREAARAALHARRTLAMLAVVVAVALPGGVLLARALRDVAAVPTTLMTLVAVTVAGYGVTALRARPIVTWAAARTFRSLRQLFPLVTRALPLLLLFVTFLFINAEVWEVSAGLDGAVLWLTVMLFGLVAVGFLLVRLPEELDRVDGLGAGGLVPACRGTPLETHARELADGPAAEPGDLRVHGLERANLVLVLLIAQAVQVLLLALSVFAFFLLFGAVVMSDDIQRNWTGDRLHEAPLLSHLTLELVQVSVFLAAFSALYFTVYAVTDEAYRDQFFTEVKRELDRAVSVRAVYLAVAREGRDG